MTDKLVVVIIDDREEDSREVARRAGEYFDVYEVRGIDDVAVQTAKLASRSEPVVDIILCDVNMEDDRSSRSFTIEAGTERFKVAPRFDMAFSERPAATQDEAQAFERSRDFKPYGPILALPFAQYFQGGGVTAPISAYWNDHRLIRRTDLEEASSASAEMNGFTYTALRLIWDRSEPGTGADQFLEAFAECLSRAYTLDPEASPSDLMMEQLNKAVEARRRQLFEGARVVQGLGRILPDGLLDEQGADLVTIWSDCSPTRQLQLKSLFADFAFRMRSIRDKGAAGHRFVAHEETQFARELSLAPSGPDPQRLRDLCFSFVDGLRDSEEAVSFAERYLYALDRSGGADATVPAASRPRDAPSYVRRYLLLTTQLYLHSVYLAHPDEPSSPTVKKIKEKPINWQTCFALGVSLTSSQEPKDFIFSQRGNNRADDFWLRPFLSGPTQTGWHGFNLRMPPKTAGPPRWTDLDRFIGTAVWRHLGEDDPAPFGLGGRLFP